MDHESPAISLRADRKAIIAVMIALCFAGLALRLSLGWSKGFLGDLQCWQMWGLDPDEPILAGEYGGFVVHPKNYPPLYASVVRVMRWIHRGLGLPGQYNVPLEYKFDENPAAWRPLILYLKSPIILADMIAPWVLLAIAAHLGKAWAGVGMAGLYLFSPAILYDGSYFGQTDTILVLLLMIAVWAYLKQRPMMLGAVLMAASLTKAQTIFALPIFAAACLGQWRQWGKGLPRFTLGCLLSLGIVAALAFWTGEQRQFYKGYAGIVGTYPLVSVRAFNFWWLLLRPWDRAPMHYDLPRDDVHVLGPITYRHLGEALYFVALAVIIWRLHRARYTPYAFMLALVGSAWAFFNLCTQMHERYSVPAVGLMTLLVMWDRKWIWLTLTCSFSAMFNVACVCPFIYPFSKLLVYLGNLFIHSESQIAWVFFAVIHILMLPAAIESLWRQDSRHRAERKPLPGIAVPP